MKCILMIDQYANEEMLAFLLFPSVECVKSMNYILYFMSKREK